MILLEELSRIAAAFDPTRNGSPVLQEILAQAQTAINVCWAVLWQFDSLQDLFRRVMLNAFMPEQENLLQEYAKGLKFNNDAATMIQQIVQILSNVQLARSQFAGPPTDDKSKQQMEANIQTDLQEISQALQQITTDLAILTRTSYGSDPDIVQGKADLINQLTGLASNLQVAQGQLTTVARDLQTGSGSLAQDLNLLLNGDGSSQPPGGLGNILDDANGYAQQYASVSLEKEFNLQILMSRVQQEWEITTSCLQTINESYMQFARSIYK